MDLSLLTNVNIFVILMCRKNINFCKDHIPRVNTCIFSELYTLQNQYS